MGNLINSTSADSTKIIEINNNIKAHLIATNHKNSGNIISALSVWTAIQLLPNDLNLFETLYQNMDSLILRQTTLGQLLQKHKAERSLPSFIPEANLYDEFMADIQFKSLLGEDYTFIDFWASWCAPCRKEIPKLKQLEAKYKSGKKVKFVSISTDSDLYKWKKALEAEKMSWEQAIVQDKNNDKTLANHWGVLRIPHGVLIDSNFKTIENKIRSADQLEVILANLLHE